VVRTQPFAVTSGASQAPCPAVERLYAKASQRLPKVRSYQDECLPYSARAEGYNRMLGFRSVEPLGLAGIPRNFCVEGTVF